MDNFDLKKYIKNNLLINELNIGPDGELEGDFSEYYAIVNTYGDPKEGTPYYIVADSKEDLINKINKAIESQSQETGVILDKYNLNSIENISDLPHIISDDWVLATGRGEVFWEDMEEFENRRGFMPKKFA